MFELLVLFAHLLGVCVALGMIVVTDLRLLARVFAYRVVIPAPSRFERRVVMAALLLLYVSGAVLTVQRLQANADYLANPKFQAKLVLVGILSVNAFVLHATVFPLLERGRRVAHWSASAQWKVALSVGLSNSLWLYCAFLGIARPWNHVRSLSFVLAVAPVLWLAFAAAIHFVLALASRDEPRGRQDWLDSLKSTFGSPSAAGQGSAPHRAAADASLIVKGPVGPSERP